MTIASNVKTCISSLKSAEATFSQFAIKSSEEEARQIFHECMMETSTVIEELNSRLSQLEREEPQYKGF